MDGRDRRIDRTRTRPGQTRIRTGDSEGLAATSRSRVRGSAGRVRVVVSAAIYVLGFRIVELMALDDSLFYKPSIIDETSTRDLIWNLFEFKRILLSACTPDSRRSVDRTTRVL